MPKVVNISDAELERLISAYIDLRASWLATAESEEDLVSEGDEFEALQTVSRAILLHPCMTLETVRRKISIVLDIADLYIMMKEDEDDDGDLLRAFLSSLMAPTART